MQSSYISHPSNFNGRFLQRALEHVAQKRSVAQSLVKRWLALMRHSQPRPQRLLVHSFFEPTVYFGDKSRDLLPLGSTRNAPSFSSAQISSSTYCWSLDRRKAPLARTGGSRRPLARRKWCRLERAKGDGVPVAQVWLIKGRDYWLWTTGGLWSGKQ